jgi:hypothetical protein
MVAKPAPSHSHQGWATRDRALVRHRMDRCSVPTTPQKQQPENRLYRTGPRAGCGCGMPIERAPYPPSNHIPLSPGDRSRQDLRDQCLAISHNNQRRTNRRTTRRHFPSCHTTQIRSVSSCRQDVSFRRNSCRTKHTSRYQYPPTGKGMGFWFPPGTNTPIPPRSATVPAGMRLSVMPIDVLSESASAGTGV